MNVTDLFHATCSVQKVEHKLLKSPIYVRELTMGEYERFMKELKESEESETQPATMMRWACCDASGKFLLMDSKMEDLESIPQTVINIIADVFNELNFKSRTKKEVEKEAADFKGESPSPKV